MTRNDFIDNVTTWGELKEICDDFGYDLDVYDRGAYDDEVESDMSDRECDWRELRDYLNDLPTGYDYYRRNGWLDYYGLDDDEDFQTEKDEVEEWMADNDYFDAEDDDEEEDAEPVEEYADEEEPDDGEKAEDEDFSVGDLIGMCGVALFTIHKKEEADAKEQEEQFAKLLSMSAATNRII